MNMSCNRNSNWKTTKVYSCEVKVIYSVHVQHLQYAQYLQYVHGFLLNHTKTLNGMMYMHGMSRRTVDKIKPHSEAGLTFYYQYASYHYNRGVS